MKVRILKPKLVEVEKTRLNEVWDKQLHRWDEFEVESIHSNGKCSHLITYDGDVYLSIPNDCFEKVK